MSSSPRLDVTQYLHRSYGSDLTLVESFLLSRREFNEWLQNDPQAPVSVFDNMVLHSTVYVFE
jgi:hypothetical protein